VKIRATQQRFRARFRRLFPFLFVFFSLSVALAFLVARRHIFSARATTTSGKSFLVHVSVSARFIFCLCFSLFFFFFFFFFFPFARQISSVCVFLEAQTVPEKNS